MNAYVLTLFAHVAAATALVGTSLLAAPAVRAAMRRARDRQDMQTCLALAAPLERIAPLSALLVLGTGMYLASVTRFWGLPWVQLAIACWVVNAVVANALVRPAIGRVAAELAADARGGIGDQLDALRWSPRWSVGGDVLIANDGVMLFLMIAKPGLAGCLLAIGAANAVVLSLGAVVRRRAQRAAVARTQLQSGWRAVRPAVQAAVYADGNSGSSRRLQTTPPGEDTW